jgi:hypothetical protein
MFTAIDVLMRRSRHSQRYASCSAGTGKSLMM